MYLRTKIRMIAALHMIQSTQEVSGTTSLKYQKQRKEKRETIKLEVYTNRKYLSKIKD